MRLLHNSKRLHSTSPNQFDKRNHLVRDPEVLQQVKSTLNALTVKAPGRAIEVRIPPYAAVQCGEGPTHTRGTPPNTIEMDAQTWLALAAGELSWDQAVASGAVLASGLRADLAQYLPL